MFDAFAFTTKERFDACMIGTRHGVRCVGGFELAWRSGGAWLLIQFLHEELMLE